MTVFPAEALAQHTAVLGKTGSGKTSTTKLMIEQVVADGARVCILDTIKSDWWGITSSADGKKPGLPFQILGGPMGHVPLPSSAGSAVAEIVANGSLPLSIIDMADFEPGGLQRFFVDFAPSLLKKMRGVVYLVIEEAHEVAPKERAGFGAENMAIHWAKKLATAGRSRGIRLIVATQRTQSIHNAILGSCETMIVHRLSAPADQKPVLDWLKANSPKNVMEEVSTSLSSLKTGTAWLCSGEAKIFERKAFPRFKTYDNTATPTSDAHEHNVKMAPVDLDRLRTIIGEAVEEAEQNDPSVLKRKIADLQKQIAGKARASAPDREALLRVERDAEERGRAEGHEEGYGEGWEAAFEAMDKIRGAQPRSDRSAPTSVPAATPIARPHMAVALRSEAEPSDGVSKPQQRILDALLWFEQVGVSPVSKDALAFLAGASSTSGGYFNNLGRLRSASLIDYPAGGTVALTDAGRKLANPPERIGTLRDLHDAVRQKLPAPMQRIFDEAVRVYPKVVPKETLAEKIGVSPTSGGYFNNLGRLRTLGLIDYPTPGAVQATPIMFPSGLR
jgi:uncharacterized protein DUF87